MSSKCPAAAGVSAQSDSPPTESDPVILEGAVRAASMDALLVHLSPTRDHSPDVLYTLHSTLYTDLRVLGLSFV